jgi:hypothetical protein
VSYLHIAYSVEPDTIIKPVDRPNSLDGPRIVNLDVGGIALMFSQETEAETEKVLARLLDAVQTLHAASVFRLTEETLADPVDRVEQQQADLDRDAFGASTVDVLP